MTNIDSNGGNDDFDEDNSDNSMDDDDFNDDDGDDVDNDDIDRQQHVTSILISKFWKVYHFPKSFINFSPFSLQK